MHASPRSHAVASRADPFSPITFITWTAVSSVFLIRFQASQLMFLLSSHGFIFLLSSGAYPTVHPKLLQETCWSVLCPIRRHRRTSLPGIVRANGLQNNTDVAFHQAFANQPSSHILRNYGQHAPNFTCHRCYKHPYLISNGRRILKSTTANLATTARSLRNFSSDPPRITLHNHPFLFCTKLFSKCADRAAGKTCDYRRKVRFFSQHCHLRQLERDDAVPIA